MSILICSKFMATSTSAWSEKSNFPLKRCNMLNDAICCTHDSEVMKMSGSEIQFAFFRNDRFDLK